MVTRSLTSAQQNYPCQHYLILIKQNIFLLEQIRILENYVCFGEANGRLKPVVKCAGVHPGVVLIMDFEEVSSENIPENMTTIKKGKCHLDLMLNTNALQSGCFYVRQENFYICLHAFNAVSAER